VLPDRFFCRSQGQIEAWYSSPITLHTVEEQLMITRAEATEQILAAKKAKGLTFEAIAKAVGRHKVWVTAALMGQAPMSAEEANAAAQVLGLEPEVAEALQEIPMKGSLDSAVPVDPLIYRFHEITQVYGTTIKALIHEMFGDGIMSAIDFEMDIRKEDDPKGDRVVVTYSGKFLPYRKW
jgi:cyanate lyase